AANCKSIVNSDLVINKLKPYLRMEESVCRKLYMCGNEKTTNAHRIGLLFLKSAMERIDGEESSNDALCADCQLTANDLRMTLGDQSERAAVKTFISEKICAPIPKYQGACDVMLEQFLPDFWKQLDTILANPKAPCSQMGFCAKQSALPPKKVA
ncbi:hypothetical protein PENTCL1PPCAC_14928, partial [Pristionchus entomophagus]